jgi:hypothetical protein
MRATVLDEPELEFGAGGRHIDPRFGIANYGPLDAGTDSAPTRIRVGIVGPSAAVEGIRSWLQRAREPINAKEPRYPGQATLFPKFPGFDSDHSFRSVLVLEDRNMRTVPAKAVKHLATQPYSVAVQAAVDAYIEEIEWLAETDGCDVIICARPVELDVLEVGDEDDKGPEAAPTAPRTATGRRLRADFHDQLKATAMRYHPPLQIMRPRTWDDTYRPPAGVAEERAQDPATRAWNLHNALYYKAGGAPWRLVRSYSDDATCYLGISFYVTPSATAVHTSVAQLFNEKGEGVVVRGGPAAVTKDDRRPYLTEADAALLLSNALAAYKKEHGHFPARLVIHKTSRFAESERAGFNAAAEEHHIDLVELVWIQGSDPMRAFRHGQHPPLRGTYIVLASDRYALYTRGSVDFYETYPGMYIPEPLSIRPVEVHHQPEQLAQELLALTKLNWNQSQLDGKLPITLRASEQVRAILKHVAPGEAVARRYGYYM